ncbi:MAG: 50S ribosomal protein L19e [Candidatus Pacearchaeota archaeon]|nr:50S ribosomal protein L19e [Candidatus Pacearchaeota archaeon]
MKTLNPQKRMAAKALNVGENKVWFDPERISEIKEAITQQDIIDLIKDKAIKRKPHVGRKRRAGKINLKRRKKGRRRGPGHIKKVINKKDYIYRIRKLRSFLKSLKDINKINNEEYRKTYTLLKAGMLKNKKAITEYIKEKQKE